MASKINNLCTPAQLYLFFTLLSLVIMVYENSGTPNNMLCMGKYRCRSPNKMLLVFVKLIYIAFWTFVLNLMCKGGYKNFAWFLVLLPLILFILVLLFGFGPWIYTERYFEGMENNNENIELEDDDREDDREDDN
jgi:hypothetical protein